MHFRSGRDRESQVLYVNIDTGPQRIGYVSTRGARYCPVDFYLFDRSGSLMSLSKDYRYPIQRTLDTVSFVLAGTLRQEVSLLLFDLG